jgi:non-heme chloroperoxidase
MTGALGAAMSDTPNPVVFIHGLWLHASSWDAWQELFTRAGFAPVAPPWPGDAPTVAGSRGNPAPLAGRGIDEVTSHYAALIRALPAPPVIVGHSFGGLIAQKLLGQGLGSAGVAIDPAPIKGVRALPLSALRVASVALRDPRNWTRAVSLTFDQFRYGFANALPQAEASELYDRWTVPSPGRPLFEAALASFQPHSPAAVQIRNGARGPLLLTSGGADRTVPPAVVRATLGLYRGSGAVTELHTFPGLGHSLTIDHSWRQVADSILRWLAEKGLAPTPGAAAAQQ